jgi:hypothetical protein
MGRLDGRNAEHGGRRVGGLGGGMPTRSRRVLVGLRSGRSSWWGVSLDVPERLSLPVIKGWCHR